MTGEGAACRAETCRAEAGRYEKNPAAKNRFSTQKIQRTYHFAAALWSSWTA
jgi:hypothetical protein